ncbi:MAG: BlaI/MecI/CopY family transcriptional regulator [Candidatus Bathyarchaeia archaeon]|jgi:predicted transcriptional regulator
MSDLPADKTPAITQYNIEGRATEAFLGPLEATIINIMWNSKKPLSVREVYEILKKNKKIAYTTVMSTMDRLHTKNLLDRQIQKRRGGIYYAYWPKFGKQNFEQSAVREVISSLLQNFGKTVTNSLIEEMETNDQELKALKERIEEALKTKKK